VGGAREAGISMLALTAGKGGAGGVAGVVTKLSTGRGGGVGVVGSGVGSRGGGGGGNSYLNFESAAMAAWSLIRFSSETRVVLVAMSAAVARRYPLGSWA
jgi:hypothetical protein